MTHEQIAQLVRSQPRSFNGFRYLYAVYSRRSGGISVGVNLNPDASCNFRCLYCQVNRIRPSPASGVSIPRLTIELREILQQCADGRLFRRPPFALLPRRLRRLQDIAFSGDGEPTLCPLFPEAVRAVATVKKEAGLEDTKIVLLTNASRLDRAEIQEAMGVLDRHHGEIWAKLDAGTEAYYNLVCRAAVPFKKILRNILVTAHRRPLTIQSLFQRIHGRPPPPEEIRAYGQRLRTLVGQGARLLGVQVYTIARPPAEPYCSPLPHEALQAIARKIRKTSGVPARAF